MSCFGQICRGKSHLPCKRIDFLSEYIALTHPNFLQYLLVKQSQILNLVKTYYIKVNFGNCASLFIKILKIYSHKVL
ncbi:hypothetical protein [Moraxella lacunata]|uniref:hypothetical protein n=1 Tax=Moraxella lacunata TaxID=477 RepID=UPI003EDE8A58